MATPNSQETDSQFNLPENRKSPDKRGTQPVQNEFDLFFAREDVPVSLSRLLIQYVAWINFQSDQNALAEEIANANEPEYLFTGPRIDEEDEDLDDEEEPEGEVEYWQPLWNSFLQFAKEINGMLSKDNLTMKVDYIPIKTHSEKIVVPDAFAGLFQSIFQEVARPDEKIKTCADVRITDIDGNLIETLRIPIELMTGTFANPFSVGVSTQLFQKLEGHFLEIDQVYNDVDNTVF